MSKVITLRSERAQINDRVQALAAIGSMSAEQQVEFDQLSAKFADLTGQIARAESAEKMAAASAVPVDQPSSPIAEAGNADKVFAQAAAPKVKGAGMAHMVMALVAAQGNQQLAARIADERGYGADVAASLNKLTPGAGGVLVPANLSSEVIELLRPKSVVRALGARTVPLVNGNLTIPRLAGGAVVGYIGSDSDAGYTGQTFDNLTLSAKKLAALVPISNDLLRYSGVSQNVDQIVVGDLTSAVASREDKAFIRDDGTSNTPKGLRYWAQVSNVVAATAGVSPTLAAVDLDLNKAILFLEAANANLTSPGWMMSPRTYRFLTALRDGNGNKVYPELDNGMLKGYPVGRTTQIPNNLSDGTNVDCSELYFADFGDCFIGEADGLMIDYSKEATYSDGTNTISAFQRDQTLVRVIAQHDFGPRHVESIAVLKNLRWGA